MRCARAFRDVGLAALASCVLASRPTPARAQNAGDQAAAEALFDQGKAAMAAQKYAEACTKFFESNRLDAGIGTSLWLAECYEKDGKTASAWAEFREAAALAVKAGDGREKVARARAAALESKLARLSIVVPPAARVPGLRVLRDATEVGAPLWGTSVPTDPGHHVITASAPGSRTETVAVDVTPGPGEQSVLGPGLGAAIGPVVGDGSPGGGDVAPPPTRVGWLGTQRVVALAGGGTAVVLVVVASYFGLHAKSLLDSSNAGHCGTGNLCDATGVADRSSAQSSATASTALFVVAAGALAGGAALWLTAPPASAAPPPPVSRLSPWFDPALRSGGLVVRTAF